MQDVAPRDYRDAMACLGAAVSIVTTDGAAGRAGFTASAICSVTDDPPTLLVCINRGSSAYASVTRNRAVCVNVLSARHEQLSRLFGGKVPAEERFAAADWSTLTTGAPLLADCAAAFDCRIADIVNVGTHDVLFCRVVALQRSECPDNLIYFGRTYHTIGMIDPAEAGPKSPRDDPDEYDQPSARKHALVAAGQVRA